ncbi:hypothetical protein AB0A69_33490 [Streptomyces sp. NPDC045431]|uniref:hypothetical protein n=1 Tax=Streptomyces sp. NPDC045431 TaxID=3155613 RepID=UPI0033E20987
MARRRAVPVRLEFQAACRELDIIPTGTSTGPWHEHTNTQIRDTMYVLVAIGLTHLDLGRPQGALRGVRH